MTSNPQDFEPLSENYLDNIEAKDGKLNRKRKIVFFVLCLLCVTFFALAIHLSLSGDDELSAEEIAEKSKEKKLAALR